MGKASSSKKVARAASIGGGKVASASRPWVWWAVLSAVVVLGIGGVALSRGEYREEAGPTNVAPVANKDHWHAAYGVYLCDEFAPPIQIEEDPKGIHTHADGVIHVHPFFRSAAGENAVLAVFTEAVGMTLTDDKLQVPGGELFEEGKTECDGKPGIVQVLVDSEVVTEGMPDIRFADRQLLTIAFAPKGTELPPPPSAPNLDNLSDVEPTSQTPPVQTPPAEAPPAEAPSGDGDGGTERDADEE
jgi:hypothetical protein